MRRALLVATMALLGVGIALADRAGSASFVVLAAAVVSAAAAVVVDALSAGPAGGTAEEQDVHVSFTWSPLSGEGDFSRRT